MLFCRLLLLVQFLDKSALVQLCDKACIDELFGLVTADLGPPRRDDIEDGFQALGYRIWRGKEILLVRFTPAVSLFLRRHRRRLGRLVWMKNKPMEELEGHGRIREN